MDIAPTPKDVLHREGTARLYRFRGPGQKSSGPAEAGEPLLLIPSLINRWYVLDLLAGGSLVESLVEAGLDTYCLDWGIPEDEDRYLEWDQVLHRLARAVRVVQRSTGAKKVGLLGYCMGGTLSGIHTALHPEQIAALANLAGPFDFSKAGILGEMVDPRWFDPDSIADAGNVSPMQMQSGFQQLRPTAPLSKWAGLMDKLLDEKARESFFALETWAGDNIPFPAAAYRTYIGDLYQKNALIKGEHYVAGQRVDLGQIRCPVLTIVTERDTICPPPAARGLADLVGSSDKTELMVPGGHVGAVVGARAKSVLYPKVVEWMRSKLHKPVGKKARPEALS